MGSLILSIEDYSFLDLMSLMGFFIKCHDLMEHIWRFRNYMDFHASLSHAWLIRLFLVHNLIGLKIINRFIFQMICFSICNLRCKLIDKANYFLSQL